MRGRIASSPVAPLSSPMPRGTGSNVVISWGSYSDAAADQAFGSADSIGNTLSVIGGSVNFGVGGRAAQGNASGNTLNISGSGEVNVGTGGLSDGGDAHGNRVLMDGGGTLNALYGGRAQNGNADDNVVEIRNGTVSSNHATFLVVGSAGDGLLSGYHTANRNSLIISGGTINGEARVGQTGTGEARGNTVLMTGGEAKFDLVAGSVEFAGDAYENEVTVSGGTVGSTVAGGNSLGRAHHNRVTFSATSFAVVGGGAQGDSFSNIVSISGGNAKQVIGGSSLDGNATENTVEVSGGAISEGAGIVTGALSGGSTSGGNAEGNTVTLLAGEVRGRVAGGEIYAQAASMGRGDAVNNAVLISGGEVIGSVNGGVLIGNMADSASGRAAGNRVDIEGGLIQGDVAGGAVTTSRTDAGTGSAEGNAVTISGGEVRGALRGGMSVRGPVSGNSVLVAGGVVRGPVSGGHSEQGDASGNEVRLEGGRIDGIVSGGSVDSLGGAATGNSIYLSAGSDLRNASLYGGWSTAAGTAGDLRSGNALHVRGFHGRVSNLGNFADYDFLLPAAAGDDSVILAVSGAANLGGAPNTITARISGMAEGGARLRPGDTIHLVRSSGSFDGSGVALTGGSFRQGLAALYDYALTLGADALNAVILGKKTPPEAEAPSDNTVAGGGLINGGNDLILGQGMESALIEARKARLAPDQPTPRGVGVFGVGSGGVQHYDVAAGLKLRSSHLAMGLSKLFRLGPGEALLGAFFDAGFGSYSAERDGGLNARGHNRYFGGGVLARYALTTGATRGMYLEGSARAGQLKSRYGSEDLSRIAGRSADFTTRTPYLSGHGKLGYLLPLGERADLDVYGSFLWMRLSRSEARVAGDEFSFDPLNSRRIRGGLCLILTSDDRFSFFIGTALERELDGRAGGSVEGEPLAGSSSRGLTGLGEAGARYLFGREKNVSLDLGVQGFTGKREGVMGQARLQYAF